MKFKSVSIEHFKVIPSWSYELNGENKTIIAKNGKGKTTIADAIQWLLSDKDTQGRSSAKDLRPHDTNNNPIRGLTMKVKVSYDIDGTVVFLEKNNAEVIKKGVVSGFVSTCFIDGEPTSVGDFKKYISAIIPADKLLTLTILDHFCHKMHHTDRRKELLNLIEVSTVPPGFDELKESAGNKTMEGYLKSLKFLLNGDTNNKGYKGEQQDITPRIDELTRQLEGYDTDDSSDDLNGIRVMKEKLIAGFRKDRLAITNAESQRNTDISLLNKSKSDKILREAFLESDISNVQKYVDEKQNITIGIGKIKMQISGVNNDITSLISEMKVIRSVIISTTDLKNSCRDQIDKLESKDSNDKAETCPKCGFVLNEEDVLKEIARLNELGKNSFMKSNSLRNTHEEKQAELIELQDTVSKYMISLNDAEKARTDRFTAIDEMLTQRVGIAPADDSEWVEICKNINTLENQIGDSIAEKVIAIDEKISSTNQGLADINKMLSDYDNANKTISRIAEIEQHEMELGQKIIEIEGELSLIAEYKTAQNNIISESVNKMFKYVTFRMFKKNIGDDGVTDDCTAIYRPNGTAYPDCSTGEKIIIGIDIINTSSDYFDLSVPLFIDNAESLTKPIDRKGQFIRLVAEKGVDKLIVEKNK